MFERSGKEGWTGQVLWEQRFDDKRLTVVAQPFFKKSAVGSGWSLEWATLRIREDHDRTVRISPLGPREPSLMAVARASAKTLSRPLRDSSLIVQKLLIPSSSMFTP